jgi:predicted DNA-binding transcriptional regulator AlpA
VPNLVQLRARKPYDHLLTLSESAAILGISENSARALRKRGNYPPAIRVGRNLRWTRDDVDAWITRNREVRA